MYSINLDITSNNTVFDNIKKYLIDIRHPSAQSEVFYSSWLKNQYCCDVRHYKIGQVTLEFASEYQLNLFVLKWM